MVNLAGRARLEGMEQEFQPNPGQLAAYVAGECTAMERAAIERQLAASPAQRVLVDRLRQARNVALAQGETSNTKRVTAEVLHRIDQLRPPHHTTYRNTISPRWWGVAVITSAFVVAFAIGMYKHPADTSRHYASGIGQRTTITLADGSRVTLASQSHLDVPADFGGEARQVSLVGEAFFDVAHAKGVPFVVSTGQVHTRVLGTTFDVKRYAHEAAAIVTVLSGKVATGATTLVPLSAGSQAQVTDSSVTVQRGGTLGDVAAWTRGVIAFHDAPLLDALATLGRWYGVEFRIADPALAQEHVTVSFAGESTADVIATLRQVLGVATTVETGSQRLPVVTLRPGNTNQRRLSPTRRQTRDSLTTFTNEVGR